MALVLTTADPALWDHLRRTKLDSSVWISPTDTVYGFGAVHSNPRGLESIQKLKGVGPQPAIRLVQNLDQAASVAAVSKDSRSLLEQYWPGPISFILPTKDGKGTIALRWPSDPFLQAFLELVGEPIVSTSCNKHGEPPVESALEAVAHFPDGVDLFIDGGIRQTLTPSTLVDLCGNQPRVLRRGAVSFD